MSACMQASAGLNHAIKPLQVSLPGHLPCGKLHFVQKAARFKVQRVQVKPIPACSQNHIQHKPGCSILSNINSMIIRTECA